MITVTIRVIRNFQYRTMRTLILRQIPLHTTIANLRQQILHQIAEQDAFAPFRQMNLDTLKLYTKGQGMKPNNLIINLEHDEDWIFKDDKKTLGDLGIDNETEISFFNMEDYQRYKADPQLKWV